MYIETYIFFIRFIKNKLICCSPLKGKLLSILVFSQIKWVGPGGITRPHESMILRYPAVLSNNRAVRNMKTRKLKTRSKETRTSGSLKVSNYDILDII